MRITCPSCTAHFELPTELLGKKGRALKCASCGHSWYQSAQVEQLDLAAVMGADYAQPAAQAAQARGQVQAGAAAAAALGANGRPTRGQVQVGAMAAAAMGAHGGPQQQPRGPQGQPNSFQSPPVPPGAVSMMRRMRPPGSQAGAMGQPGQQRGAHMPGHQPQALSLGQPGPGQPGQPQAPWYQGAANAPGANGGPTAGALSGQSMRGQAGAQAVGDAALSWTRGGAVMPPGGAPGGMPGMPGMPGAPGGLPGGMQGGPGMAPLPPGAAPGAAALSGQSMRGQAGAQAVGDGSVSWMDDSRTVQPGRPMAPGAPGGPGAPQPMPGLPGQSMMGQAGAQAVGDTAVSWMGRTPQQAQPGQRQSMRDQGAMAGPGAPAVSQLTGAIAGPGGPAVSQLTGAIAGPGAPAVSQLTGKIEAPGQDARSLLDGAVIPGNAGQSMMGPGATGGPGQPTVRDGAAGDAAAADARIRGQGELLSESGAGRADAQWDSNNAGGKSDGPGTAGAAGPGKGSADELIDPNADRPDFGVSDESDPEAVTDEDGEEESAFASIAARAGGGKPLAAPKPINPAYVTAGVMASAILALGLLVWLGRGIMLDIWPGIAGFYERVGAQAKQPGDGLKIAESSKRLQRIGGIETLVVNGFISNIAQVPETVPNLKLELYNEKHEVVQDASAKSCSSLLDPGATCQFEVKLELPNIAAAKGGYAVVWQK